MEPTVGQPLIGLGNLWNWVVSDEAANLGTFLGGTLAVLLAICKLWKFSNSRWRAAERAECAGQALTLIETYQDKVIKHIDLAAHYPWLEWAKMFEDMKEDFYNPAYAKCKRLGHDPIDLNLQDLRETLRAIPDYHRLFYDDSFGLTGKERAEALGKFNASRSSIKNALEALSVQLAEIALIRP